MWPPPPPLPICCPNLVQTSSSIVCSTVGSRSLYVINDFSCVLSFLPHTIKTVANFIRYIWNIKQIKTPQKKNSSTFDGITSVLEDECTLSDV